METSLRNKSYYSEERAYQKNSWGLERIKADVRKAMKPACILHVPQIRDTASAREEPRAQGGGVRSRFDGQQITRWGKSWAGRLAGKPRLSLLFILQTWIWLTLVLVEHAPPTWFFLFCSHSPLFGLTVWLVRNSETMWGFSLLPSHGIRQLQDRRLCLLAFSLHNRKGRLREALWGAHESWENAKLELKADREKGDTGCPRKCCSPEAQLSPASLVWKNPTVLGPPWWHRQLPGAMDSWSEVGTQLRTNGKTAASFPNGLNPPLPNCFLPTLR